MTFLAPGALSGDLVVLEPLAVDHAEALREATLDGRVWELWHTSAPEPNAVAATIAEKLEMAQRGALRPFAVRRRADDRPSTRSPTINGRPSDTT